MDKSKEYVEMCKQAEEIQNLDRQHNIGDFIDWDGIIMVVVDGSATEGGVEYQAGYFVDDTLVKQWFSEEVKQTTWLPRQDQLQHIMADNETLKVLNTHPITQVNRLRELMDENCAELKRNIDNKETPIWMPMSHEQWWLIVVMHWSYKKKWDDKVKEWLVNKSI